MTLRLRRPIVGRDHEPPVPRRPPRAASAARPRSTSWKCAATPVGAGPVVAASVVRSLPDRLAEHQRLFGETGGLHAAARFTTDG